MGFFYLDIWIFGYLDDWISDLLDIWIVYLMYGYLDCGRQAKMMLQTHFEFLCGAALPGVFLLQGNTRPWCFATRNNVPCILPEQYSMGLGYVDAD